MLRHFLRPLGRAPFVGRLLRLGASLVREARYRLAPASRALGEVTWVWREPSTPGSGGVQARWNAEMGSQAAIGWCRQQTLLDLWAVGLDVAGEVRWRVDRDGPLEPSEVKAPEWICVPDPTDALRPDAWECSRAVAAAEDVDVVVHLSKSEAGAQTAEEVLEPPLLHRSLFRANRFTFTQDAKPTAEGSFLVKELGSHSDSGANDGRFRRGAYLASRHLPARLEVGVRSARRPGLRRAQPGPRSPMLVLVPFFARGGAEHTLYETLAHLRDRFEYTFVSLAPHRPELGDRRDDFGQVGQRLLSLGDWVHPAAMPGILDALIDSTGARILYNANGSTLFYDFAPDLRRRHPELLIIDHLYDHEIGYIGRYGSELLSSVDLCVAENHRIRETLAREKGWPEERAPVIWPCGRSAGSFPEPGQHDRVRNRLRRELGLGEDHLMILTAARMHRQKRPLDLVQLAERLRDVPVFFLIAGGGDLEDEVDRAISRSAGAPIRRLGFRTDIPELIVAADVGCLVSDYEGLPVFLLECLQAGRPFLGTAVGEMGRVIRETGAGLVVEQPGDLDALEAAIHTLLRPADRSELARRAENAGRRFDVVTCAESYARVFASAPAPRAQK